MSLKNANPRIWSITARLTVFYASATFLFLAILSLILYFNMVGILYENDKQFLIDEMNIVKSLLQEGPQNEMLQHEIVDAPKVLTGSIYHYAIRLSDKNNHTFMETKGRETLFQSPKFFARDTKLNEPEEQWWFSPEGGKYLLMQDEIKIKDKTWKIQAALNVSYQHGVITQSRQLALFILFGGELIAIFLSYLIARHGLRRLYDLTETTRNITANSLHQRILVTSWPQELSNLGAAFNGMLERIEIAFSKLTQFSADLAHELRTPINNLLGETEIALSHKGSVEEYRQVLESNIEELHRISHMIENILFLARVESPDLEIAKTVLHVKEEITFVTDYYEALAQEKNITVTSTGSATIYANQMMFRRLISNLLANALKYTPENGKIVITIENQPTEVVITIADNGIGIPAEHLPKIFNRFYRVDAARSTKEGGIGLGLPIAKSIMQLHNAKITIQSLPKKGTTLTLQFPN